MLFHTLHTVVHDRNKYPRENTQYLSVMVTNCYVFGILGWENKSFMESKTHSKMGITSIDENFVQFEKCLWSAPQNCLNEKQNKSVSNTLGFICYGETENPALINGKHAYLKCRVNNKCMSAMYD